MQILWIQSSLVLPSALAGLFDECLYSVTHPALKKSLGRKAVCRLSVKRCSDHVKKFFLLQNKKPVYSLFMVFFFFLTQL